nr:hypothetical protein [Tanacetum cinerariifolium]
MVPLIELLSVESLVSEASTFGAPVVVTTTALSTTFVPSSSIPPMPMVGDRTSKQPTGDPSLKVVFEKEEPETTPEHTTTMVWWDSLKLNISRLFFCYWTCNTYYSLSLYAPMPNASVTLYGPSHLGPSFSPSSAWLASFLWYTRSPDLKRILRTFEL